MSSPEYNNGKRLLTSLEVLKYGQERLGLACQTFLKKDEEMAGAMIGGVFVLYNEELDGLTEYLQPGTPKYQSALNEYIKNTLNEMKISQDVMKKLTLKNL